MSHQKNQMRALPFWVTLLLLPIVFVLSGLTFFATTTPVFANSAVVINELMYNPLSDNQNEEYLELYNTSGSPIDVGGWCFTAGISGCFSSGTTISANGYLLVSPNTSQTQSTYSLTPDLVYTGSLSNGGETITLVDAGSATVDSLTYDDASPWPVSPDGTGPSLELKNPLSDNSQAAAWAASLSNGGTPNSQNSTFGITLPTITDVSRNTFVQPNTAVTVTTKIEDSTDVELIYKVMFDTEQTLTMHDDGNHNDGAASDGVYGVEIPGQEAGKLVRYKVKATNIDGTMTSPGSDDSVNYYPYIIDDGQESDLPIVRWYMDPTDFTDMTTNHLADDQQFSAVVAVDDQIFDNALVRVKGQSSVNFPKRKYKFDLPAGAQLKAPIFEHPVDEFAIQVYFLNLTDMQEGLSWRAFDEFGFDGLQNRYVRAQRNTPDANSDFIGHYLLIENYDNLWRQRNDHEDGAMYKQGSDKKTRTDEDHSDIQSLVENITTLEGQQLKDYLLDNLDIPKIVNFNAISAAIFSDDWFFGKNVYQYRDTEGTGRWEYLPWDLDNSFTVPTFDGGLNNAEYLRYPITGELKKEFTGDPTYYDGAIIERAIYQFPEFREMFFRRSMNVYDQIWANDKYLQWFDEFFYPSRDTLADDLVEWNPSRKALYQMFFPDGLPWDVPDDFPVTGFEPQNFFDYLDDQTPEMGRDIYIYGANRLKGMVANYRSEGKLLPAQTTSEEKRIQITEINYNPEDSNTNLEFIELYNNSDKAVDLTGWQLPGVGFTFGAGAVIPAGHYGVIAKNDTAFRDRYPSVLVLGQYSGDLDDNGESLQLLDSQDKTVSQLSYKGGGNWPTTTDGQGFSLSLIRTNANETLAACWAPSSANGGTPGQANTLDNEWVAQNGVSCTDRDYRVVTAGQDQSLGNLANTGQNTKIFALIAVVLMASAFIIRQSRFSHAKLTIRIKTPRVKNTKLKSKK